MYIGGVQDVATLLRDADDPVFWRALGSSLTSTERVLVRDDATGDAGDLPRIDDEGYARIRALFPSTPATRSSGTPTSSTGAVAAARTRAGRGSASPSRSAAAGRLPSSAHRSTSTPPSRFARGSNASRNNCCAMRRRPATCPP